jgi:hypothetical protein
MKNSKALLKKAGILPKLRLGYKLSGGGVKPTGAHRVKIIEDKIIRKAEPSSGKEIEWVRYTLEEGGERKIYDTKLKDKSGELSYLVQRFAEIEEGDEVILEMKKQGVKNYIEVIPVGHSSTVELDDDADDSEEDDSDDDEPAPKEPETPDDILSAIPF